MEIGDKVRTKGTWNDHREPISGTIAGFETLKYHKTKEVRREDGDLIGYHMIPNQYEYTEVVVLDNGERIHESNLEKEE